MRASTSRSTAAPAKPYDRPATKSKGKGKGKAEDKAAGVGAPAQLGQASRKGKKAWRKHVDVTGEEEALERAREEERVTGGKLSTKKDSQLFMIDTTGDAEVAKKVRTKKPLRSLAVLSERSAVPSLTSRAGPPARTKKVVSSKDKNRLRRIARRTADATTSADVRATDVSGLRDAWEGSPPPLALEGGFGEEGVVRRAPKAPKTLARQREVRAAAVASQLAVEVPDAGVSYNPKAEAHQRLLDAAIEEELGRLQGEEREARRIELLGEVVVSRRATNERDSETYVNGMQVGRGDGVALEEDEDEDEDDDAEVVVKKPTKRKTQAQRNKKLRAREAAHQAKLDAERKRAEKNVGAAQAFSKTAEARLRASEEAKRLRRIAAKQRERLGLQGGEKIGKHRVPKAAVQVQLGDDLAESLRQVKPEGNLFKDRFLSLQRQALLEPRVPQLPKRRALATKEYEKHAWKRFQ